MLIIVAICAFAAAYHYALYPALVMLLARLAPAPEPKRYGPHDDWPTVTLLIAAYNEERVIGQKLRNSLALRYPKPIEILVVSDGSTDRTPAIVESHAGRGVVSMHRPERRGKTAALNRGVAAARGDVIVFSDANNDFNERALEWLVAPLADATTGGVCGVKRIRSAADRESSVGDGLYWRYESAIKDAESRLGSITNADGEIFAMWRALWKPIPEHLINDDAQITFDIIDQGRRVLYEMRAESVESASIRIEDDFHVKVRMVAGGFQTLATHWRSLLPPRSWFSLAFLSHKALRYLMPVFLLVLLAGSLLLALRGTPGMGALLGLQVAFYALAFAGWRLLRHATLPTVLYVPFYFCAMNLAALLGLMRYLRGQQGTSWRKAAR